MQVRWIELIGTVENGGITHIYLWPKSSISHIRPIAYFTVTDADNVCQSITTHICQKDALGAIRKNDSRALFLIKRFRCEFSSIISFDAFCRIPGKSIFLRNYQFGHPVAVQVNEFCVGVSEILV